MSLIDNLKAFNRKERFYLIGLALGNREFNLSDEFRETLNHSFGLNIPTGAFVAMDYHLDWVYAATLLDSVSDLKRAHENTDQFITARAEDADLLVAYELKGLTHLVLLECKGVTEWNNKQFLSKVRRLKKIFGDDGRKLSGIAAHFGLISPRQSKGLKTSDAPSWMLVDGKLPYLRLEIPQGLVAITRCQADGKISKDGSYWRLKRGFAYGKQPTAATASGTAGLPNSDPASWDIKHLAVSYFDKLFKACQDAGVWPLAPDQQIWLGQSGAPYALQSGTARPNAMLESEGTTWISRRGGKLIATNKPFSKSHMGAWTYQQITTIMPP